MKVFLLSNSFEWVLLSHHCPPSPVCGLSGAVVFFPTAPERPSVESPPLCCTDSSTDCLSVCVAWGAGVCGRSGGLSFKSRNPTHCTSLCLVVRPPERNVRTSPEKRKKTEVL